MKTPDILIADDEKNTRDTIRDFLELRIKCNIYEAEDGEDTLLKLRDNDIDVMLLDIRMPKKNGIHVLDEMKKFNKNVSTIVITAWDSDLVAEECAKRNVECIPKPLTLNELYNKITKLLTQRGQLQSL